MANRKIKNIVIASDHAGFEIKELILNTLKNTTNIKDLGPTSNNSVDYPDYAEKLALFLKENEAYQGILICGSGIGISIAANRFPHIRAALCHNELTAKLSREHNNANVLVLGARIVKKEEIINIVNKFLTTKFESGRHSKRVDKLSTLNN
jgi:ribose 5-phosphate isomerase B